MIFIKHDPDLIKIKKKSKDVSFRPLFLLQRRFVRNKTKHCFIRWNLI